MRPQLLGAGEEDSYLVSVSDLMVGLLFVFIIVLMAFALNFRAAEQEASTIQLALAEARDATARQRDALAGERDQLAREVQELMRQRRALGEVATALSARDETRSRMLLLVQEQLRARGVEVAAEPDNGILRLPESALFESGEWELRPEGAAMLGELGAVLAGLLPCYSQGTLPAGLVCAERQPTLLEAVLIEGHTDDRPISTPQVQDNWTLAALRGATTFKTLTRLEPELDRLRNERGQALIGVGSYEARRPIAADDTAEARRLNRRIDLRFIVGAPSATEMGQIRRRLGAPAPIP